MMIIIDGVRIILIPLRYSKLSVFVKSSSPWGTIIIMERFFCNP